MAVIATLMLFFLLLMVTSSFQDLEASLFFEEKLTLQRRLKLINKPAFKSFTTKHGEILDCVQIQKQLAFDHPLLKNHTIQMKPSIEVNTQTKSKEYSSPRELTRSQLLPKNMICPQGTVMVKRVTEEDLAIDKMLTSTLWNSFSGPNISKFDHSNDAQQPMGNQGAYMITLTKNTGVGGGINVWGFEIAFEQFSSALVAVASDEDPNVNSIQAGWIVYPWLNNFNVTRFYAYWTKDSARTTGCYNAICPGFVQISPNIPLGIILNNDRSIYGDPNHQYFITPKIVQDVKTKSWMLYLKDEYIGYWPSELFSSLTNGGERAFWGGQIFSPKPGPAPPMGSGHFAEEELDKACFIINMELFGVNQFPSDDQMNRYMSKSHCYSLLYKGDQVEHFGQMMFFGGPANCN